MDRDKLELIQLKFEWEYHGKVAAYGYSLAVGISTTDVIKRHIDTAAELPDGRPCLSALLQPMLGSPDPIADDLLAIIRHTILPKEYEGVPVYVSYLGIQRAQKKRGG